ncbi:hypothetical protein V501_03674 [Pseudogymnoascus sp. VKM F-4519 (FW-2642)]|nr:hypothetical protein V501_03674 [Pseudogymnoascus sp. VKM F-4519 (FW-2642)]
MEPLLEVDPDIADLERRLKELHAEIKWEYKFIKRAPKKIGKEYEDLRKQLTNTSLKDEIEDAYRKDYFFRIHNEMMKMLLKRQPNKTVVEEEEKKEDVEPVIKHQLAERTQLQQILCDFSQDLCPSRCSACAYDGSTSNFLDGFEAWQYTGRNTARGGG